MGRMKDLYCIAQGEPTLHDALEAFGLPHDASRTTRRLTRVCIDDLLGPKAREKGIKCPCMKCNPAPPSAKMAQAHDRD